MSMKYLFTAMLVLIVAMIFHHCGTAVRNESVGTKPEEPIESIVFRDEPLIRVDSGYYEVVIHKPVFDSPTGEFDFSVLNQTINEFAKKLIRERLGTTNFDSLKEEVRFFHEEQDILWHYILQSDFEVTRKDENLISIVFTSYSFTGGAHGSTSMKTFNYVPSEGRFLQITDMLRMDSESIHKLNRLFSEFIEDPYDCFDEPYADESLERFAFTKDSFLCYYTEYELGPYACGIPVVKIPVEKLQSENLLTPKGAWLLRSN